ncbi:ATP-binding protein [Bradyrhizobium sp. Mp27]|uniref:ATP-binding protein n=1 Tax=Bradyrhizobium sp. Mp27 TaxID=3042157 RepID=UPI00248C68C4|nr:ATP-binding protein [Bradyrhizobium sp. Mp27]MDI2076558.1 ATP-binding protein [Bradyrhizobium sp. Mp27]
MKDTLYQKPASTELTGGAGFTYEDTVVAYYLAHLLRHERAAGQPGIVISVAVQRQGHGHPLDDVIVGLDDGGVKKSLDLQVKRSVSISAADKQFKEIVAAAVKTQGAGSFVKDTDATGFVVEHVTDTTFRSLSRLISKAKASPDAKDFGEYFAPTGTAGADDRKLREGLLALTGASNLNEEVRFYRSFAALHLAGLEEGGALRAEIVNRLQELVADNVDGQATLLFARLCRIAREGAANAAKWTRSSLLAQLQGSVRLKVTPSFIDDINRLNAASLDALNDVSEAVDDFHVPRDGLQAEVAQALQNHRVVSIGGLPGCGKSAVLKHFAADAAKSGPILFLKNDRLQGTSWTTFATALGLRHSHTPDVLAELGASGTPVLFIDGIDRIRPDQQHIITDLIRAIESSPSLHYWKVIATSRDQGLEAYRAWFPQTFYSEKGMGSVSVNGFSEEEAELLAKSKPDLRTLLFSPSSAVEQIARRPFFAAALAQALPEDAQPQNEVDLINAWWLRAGHDAMPETVPQRQRALVDLAEQGVRNLGKGISVRDLKPETIEHLVSLQADHILRNERGGAMVSFTHDIFFEWVFFRLLIELGDEWPSALTAAGEPPLLGRVVGLLAQDALTEKGRWTVGYAKLKSSTLRAQWRREWLTAPPFTNAFESAIDEFTQGVEANDFVLCGKLLVWFQAQHTVPSPIIMRRAIEIGGMDPVRMADLLGWPSDGVAWGRLIDWIIARQQTLPARLVPQALEVFSVWQNALADFKNKRSRNILATCSAWLIDLEVEMYADDYTQARGKWDVLGHEAQKSLATGLRSLILRSARGYPEFAVAVFERATGKKQMLRSAFDDLMGFAPIMAEVAPEAVERVAEAKLITELPQDTHDRLRREDAEQAKWRENIRAIPEEKRTREQNMALSSPHFPTSYSDFRRDDIGLESHNHYFHPPSALHEPFASLLANNPSVGLRLITKLTNRAITGWRQINKFRRRESGTPIPVVLEFPWGRQEFWGDWHVFGWGLGMLGSQLLQCAYLSLAYWAFKEVEKGRSTSAVIKQILDGSECYASLGLCLRLAIETFEVSETTLPIVTCQRLWEHDFARLIHEPQKDIDLFGFGFLTQLKGEKAKAKAFLESREYRKHDVRELAMRFAVSSDASLRDRFKMALEAFPENLPYIVEEERESPEITKELKEKAELWSGLGNIENYRRYETKDAQIAIGYEPPKPPAEATQERAAKAAESLHQQSVLAWALRSLNEGKPAEGWTLVNAIAFAKEHDLDDLFNERADVGPHAIQSGVSAIAASVIRFGESGSPDRPWAWNVMERVLKMREPSDFHGSKIPWHPSFHLIAALFHDRKSGAPRSDSSACLIHLASHPNEDVQIMAFKALFLDPDPHVQWVAAHFAFDLAHYIDQIRDEETFERDDTAARSARAAALTKALQGLGADTEVSFAPLPPAWVRASKRNRRAQDYWTDPECSFDGQYAAKLFVHFPLEQWCRSDVYRPKIQSLLADLARWTAERLMPPWDDKKTRQDKETNLFEWDRTLGTMLARALPFYDLAWIRNSFFKPFSPDDEEALRVLAQFAESIVTRHVFDAKDVPENALLILDDCVQRVINDKVFVPGGYRAGEVHGHDMPELIKALLFVNVDAECPGAARFVNGDWSSIAIIMPLVTKLVKATGWSTYVMTNFLTLCERAAASYPIDPFIEQATAALNSIEYAKGNWVGTSLPARLAAIIHRLAEANYPLEVTRARGLLNLLDALIDLGDRRSAALEQDEAFRRVQGLVA